MWTILPVCWPSVHMLERPFGFFCTSMWRVLMDVGRRYELHSPEPLNQVGAHVGAPRISHVVELNVVGARIRDRHVPHRDVAGLGVIPRVAIGMELREP